MAVITGEQPEGHRNPHPAHGERAVPGREASLRYGLQILGLFSSERPWLHIGEIADELNLSPPEAHAHVVAMHRMHMVREGPGLRYGLGSGPPDLGMAAIKAVGVARHVRPHLIELHRHTGLPVALAMLAGGELLLVDRPAGAKEVEMAIELDRRLPPHATALGKVLLAYLPEQREHELVEALELHPHTSRTIVDRRELLKHLQRVRTRGLAVEDGEYVARHRCMAAPVRGAGRCMVAAVGLTLPAGNDCLERQVACHASALREAARQLSGALRYVQPDWPEL